MRLNKVKYIYLANTLMKHGWGYYRKEVSTVIWWVDPLNPINDLRIKQAYSLLRERNDGSDN